MDKDKNPGPPNSESPKDNQNLKEGGQDKKGPLNPPEVSRVEAKVPEEDKKNRAVPKPVVQPRPEYSSYGYNSDGPFMPHAFDTRAELLTKTKARVLISPDAYKRMCLYVEIAPKEVGWMGTVKMMPTGDLLIERVFLLEQEVTGTETELSNDGQGKLVDELIAQDNGGLEAANALRFWGHSHVHMSTFPSGTDEGTMSHGWGAGLPWAVRGIFNKGGKAQFTIYLYEKGIRILDAPWAVLDPKKGIILERGFGGFSGFRGDKVVDNEEELVEGDDTGHFKSFFDEIRANQQHYEQRHRCYGGYSGYSGYGSSPRYLPPELKPSAEMRAEVIAEFSAKVTDKCMKWDWNIFVNKKESITGPASGEASDKEAGTAQSDPGQNGQSAELEKAESSDAAKDVTVESQATAEKKSGWIRNWFLWWLGDQ